MVVVAAKSDKNQSLKELPELPNNARITSKLHWSLLFCVLREELAIDYISTPVVS